MKPLGKAQEGKEWEIRKSAQGIPFVTDGVKSRWCMSIFQDQAPQTSAIEEVEELPSLEVTQEVLADSNVGSGHKLTGESARAELPGVEAKIGYLVGFQFHFLIQFRSPSTWQ